MAEIRRCDYCRSRTPANEGCRYCGAPDQRPIGHDAPQVVWPGAHIRASDFNKVFAQQQAVYAAYAESGQCVALDITAHGNSISQYLAGVKER